MTRFYDKNSKAKKIVKEEIRPKTFLHASWHLGVEFGNEGTRSVLFGKSLLFLVIVSHILFA